MANISELFTALERADAAGNADDARAIAAIIRQLQAEQEPKRTFAGYTKEALKGIPRGLVGGLEQAALGAAALLPGDTESGLEQTVREGVKGFAERLKPSVGAGYEEAIPTKLGEAVGSFGSLLLPGGAAGAGARLMGAGQAAQRAAQMGAVAPIAGAMGAGEARERAVQEKATPEQITQATQLGIAPGLAELAPVERVFRMLPKELTGTIINRLQRAFVTGGIEGLQEGASQIAQNLIAQQVYKPSQELIEQVGENAAYGVGAGAIVQFLVDSVAGRRAKPVPPAQPQREQPQAPIPTSAQLSLFDELPEGKAPTRSAFTPAGEQVEVPPDAAAGASEEFIARLEMKLSELKRVDAIMDREVERAPTAEAKVAIRERQAPIKSAIRGVYATLQKEGALDRASKRKGPQQAFDFTPVEPPDAKTASKALLPDTDTIFDFTRFMPEVEQSAEAQADIGTPDIFGTIEQATATTERLGKLRGPSTKVTDDVLERLGFKRGPIKTAKFAKELKRLDLNKPEDIQRFRDITDAYANSSQAKEPYNADAVEQFLSDAESRIKRQEVADDTGQTDGRAGVVAPVPQQATGRGPAAGAARTDVVGAERAAGEAVERKGAEQPALSDVEEVETAKEIAATTKSKKDFNDAITYLSYFKNSPDVGPSAKVAATKALEELGVPEAEVQAAWENVAISEAAGQQEKSEADAAAASEREQRNLAAQQRRAELAVKRGPRTMPKKPITAKERAQLASAEQRAILKAPTDVAFQTPEDANNLLETYLSDVEKGDPKRRERTKFKAQVPAREFVDEADRAEISKLMREGKFDAAHTAIVRAVQRAVTAAKADMNAKFYMREVAAAERAYRLSHRPVGSGLSKSVVQKLQKGDLKGALREIGETGSTPVIRTAARKILSGIKGTKVLIRETPTGDAGIYSSKTDTIYIDPQGLHEHTLLHEGMHAAVSHVLANPNHPLTQKLQKLFDGLAPELRGQYGATNLQEFAAEAISNQEFQDLLRGQPKNWWGRFVDAIRGFLGLSKAKQVEKTLDQLLEAAPSEARGENIGILKLPATPAMEAYAPKRIAEKQREGDQGFFKTAMDVMFDPKVRSRKVLEFRNSVVFNGAAVEQKLLDKHDLRSAVGLLMATRSSDLAVSSMLEGGITLDKSTNLFAVRQGPSLADVHQEVKNIAEKAGVDFDTASAWFDLGATLLRLRSPEITPEIRKSMNISAQDTAAGDDILRLYGKEIKAGISKFQSYKNQLLKAGMETGRFTKEDVEEWMKAPEYVPWHRILDDAKFGYETKTSTKRYFKGLVDSGKVAELIGGDVNERPIGDILTNMEQLSFWLVNTVVRNHAANTTMDGLLKIDAKAIPNPKAVSSVDRLVKTYRNGEPAFFEVGDPLDKHAFDGVEPVSTPIFKVLGQAANWLRRGTTLMPGFVVSQLFQDGFRATLMSGANRPFMVGAKVLKAFPSALRHTGTSTELAAYGIIGRPDFMVGDDQSRLRAALDEGGGPVRHVARRLRGMLDAMTRASDASQRIAVYEQTLKETGDKMLALYKASEIINFQRQGKSAAVNVLRQIIPFMNAYIQGLDVTYRSMAREGISGRERTEAMRRFWSTGMKIAALASVYAILVSDDEDYKNLPDHEKLTGLMVPGSREMFKELTGVDLGGNIRIPTPQDPVGYLFKSIPEQTLGYVLQLGTKDEVDATKLARAMRDGLLNSVSPPGGMPQLLKPTIEVVTNYSFFTGNPIVGKALEGRSKELQFTASTSELAKVLGSAGGLSPVQIDHLVRGYLGIFGGTMMYAGGRLVEEASGIERPTRQWAQVPQATTFLTGNASAGAKEDYYELRKRAYEIANDVKFLSETDPVRARERVAENRELYALAKSGVFTKVESMLSQIRKARQAIESNQTITSDEKRQRLDDLDKKEMLLLAHLNIPTLRKLAGM